ncbi:MAG: substrate-binding protein [Proteobacteria bacterium]|nr:substrate-binding protein [Pseudomonadota bacterium]MBU1586160.1 substrate-binding protein [Pseudomonadota bacterium]MBU2452991.1 substrate-binding protein [Pseudomonadota bacterium]MBU2631296.1 substrate-binding protein [Pseudomonadota bacterium]
MKKVAFLIFLFLMVPICSFAENTVKIGFNYPATGPYAAQGLDQLRGATLALEEINAAGGVLGKPLELVVLDTKTNAQQAVENAVEMIEKDKVKMIFGGVSSGVAVAVGEVCQQQKIIFMATITASNATTRENGHRHTFRVCYNAWMGAKALSSYLNKHFSGKKYFYIVADYSWGWSSEDSIRKFTQTEDTNVHKTILTKLGAGENEFTKAVLMAKLARPDVVVMVLFGNDMTLGLKKAAALGLKKQSKIVVPILELGMVEKAGPDVMENVVGTSDWNWQVPKKYHYKRGQLFVDTFVKKYQRYPCWGAATAYTNVYEYSSAANRAGSLESGDIIKALENHQFTLLKDVQLWRAFDHQNVQSVYVVNCKSKEDVLKDEFSLDYFEILDQFSGDKLVQTKSEWEAARKNAGKSLGLEPIQ